MRFLVLMTLFFVLKCDKRKKPTEEYAVEIKGGEKIARNLARRCGFIYVRNIFDDFYTFRTKRNYRRSTRSSNPLNMLFLEPGVLWAEAQQPKIRVKRSKRKRRKRLRQTSARYDGFNDPKWKRMWYLHSDITARNDMNIQGAWALGYTGRGVVVTILDDGIERNHPDLKENYDPLASYDVNSEDDDPQPQLDRSNTNRHGTRCAGEVAAKANNGECGLGVAYNARIGGVRMLDGDVTDQVESRALGFRRDYIDIYSISWGPDDDGVTVDGPARLTQETLLKGVTHGRRGLGSIYVWASGNGGKVHDSCACDGYTNSIYTLSISSATQEGRVPFYSEPCSSTLASTFSSGDSRNLQIITTDLRQTCTETHTGTSASAPLAAGIVALALQANGELSWRDVQHLVVLTSQRGSLKCPKHYNKRDCWVRNAAGREYSPYFGFGLMNAYDMVKKAANWSTVPEQTICVISDDLVKAGVTLDSKTEITMETAACAGSRNETAYLEHVQCRITLSSNCRGNISIKLSSPSGTQSIILPKRRKDKSKIGFNDWPFMTVSFWGERAQGRWSLSIEAGNDALPAVLESWTLILYGTNRHPYHAVQRRPRHKEARRKHRHRHHDPPILNNQPETFIRYPTRSPKILAIGSAAFIRPSMLLVNLVILISLSFHI